VSARDETLRAAQGYIGCGWAPFILSTSKTPVANCERCRAEHTLPVQMEACNCLTCHGFYSATFDLDRVDEMIRLHPRGLLAIRTGAPSRTAVVDVDAPHGLPVMRQLIADGQLPRTVVQQTGSGGYHLLYRHPGVRIPSGAGKGGTGVDIKADGGYIVVAPSIHPRTRKKYRWIGSCSDDLTPLPQAWVDRLREPDRAPRGNAAPPPAGPAASRYAEAALRGELERLLEAPDKQRNDTLIRSSFSLGQLVAAGLLDENHTTALLTWAAERIGLTAGEIPKTIASGFRAAAHHPRGDVAY